MQKIQWYNIGQYKKRSYQFINGALAFTWYEQTELEARLQSPSQVYVSWQWPRSAAATHIHKILTSWRNRQKVARKPPLFRVFFNILIICLKCAIKFVSLLFRKGRLNQTCISSSWLVWKPFLDHNCLPHLSRRHLLPYLVICKMSALQRLFRNKYCHPAIRSTGLFIRDT